jgi:hypothetical protein
VQRRHHLRRHGRTLARRSGGSSTPADPRRTAHRRLSATEMPRARKSCPEARRTVPPETPGVWGGRWRAVGHHWARRPRLGFIRQRSPPGGEALGLQKAAQRTLHKARCKCLCVSAACGGRCLQSASLVSEGHPLSPCPGSAVQRGSTATGLHPGVSRHTSTDGQKRTGLGGR